MDNILLRGTVGSTAYGLATENSDVDKLGIYAAPLADVFSLSGANAISNSKVSTEPDVTLHEIGKFCGLAVKGNPTVLELLYLADYDIISMPGQVLTGISWAFLSTNSVRNSYRGYAAAQVSRLARRTEEGVEGFSSDVKNRTEKHGRHCARLLKMGKQLLTEAKITINCSPFRDYLFDMGKLAATDVDKFKAEMEKEFDSFDATNSILNDQPNRDLINDWIYHTRIGQG